MSDMITGLDRKRIVLIIPKSQANDSIYPILFNVLSEKTTLMGVLVWTEFELVVDKRIRTPIFRPIDLIKLSEYLVFAPIMYTRSDSDELFENFGFFPNILAYLVTHDVTSQTHSPLICIYLTKDFGSKEKPRFWTYIDQYYPGEKWKICSFRLKFTHRAYFLPIDKIYSDNLEENLVKAIISNSKN